MNGAQVRMLIYALVLFIITFVIQQNIKNEFSINFFGWDFENISIVFTAIAAFVLGTFTGILIRKK